MPTYEVTYEVAGEQRTALVEAPGPVAAQQRFEQETSEVGAVVICVVRQ
jgi:hypothetical protein